MEWSVYRANTKKDKYHLLSPIHRKIQVKRSVSSKRVGRWVSTKCVMYVLKHINETEHFDDEYSPFFLNVTITYHFEYLSTALATVIQHHRVQVHTHYWDCTIEDSVVHLRYWCSSLSSNSTLCTVFRHNVSVTLCSDRQGCTNKPLKNLSKPWHLQLTSLLVWNQICKSANVCLLWLNESCHRWKWNVNPLLKLCRLGVSRTRHALKMRWLPWKWQWVDVSEENYTFHSTFCKDD